MSMADIGRLILAAEEKFFNECNTGNGRLLVVIVVIIMTLI